MFRPAPKPSFKNKAKSKKKTAKQIAKDSAWEAFSDFIRLRDCIRTTGTFNRCRCITCNLVVAYKSIQAGHAISGRSNSILFHEQIVNGQCVQCNILKGGNYEKYAVAMIARYGLEKYRSFEALRRVPLSLSTKDYIDIMHDYRRKLLELKMKHYANIH